MAVQIEPSWQELLESEFSKPYFKALTTYIRQEYYQHTCYPAPKKIFAAFNAAPVANVKVVILGQDPYHGPNQANGLCFSVSDQTPLPPSLINIYKEISRDLRKTMPLSGNLERWANQGVLLLNSTLTVRAGQAGSHQNFGWEIFTDEVIKNLVSTKENLVFMLWGAYAQKKGSFIDRKKHLVLEAPHPSPLSAHRGFIGCGHFSKTNEYLWMNGQLPIEW